MSRVAKLWPGGTSPRTWTTAPDGNNTSSSSNVAFFTTATLSFGSTVTADSLIETALGICVSTLAIFIPNLPFQHVLKNQRADIWMHAQPKSGVLVELGGTRRWVAGDLRLAQPPVTLAFGWCGTGSDDRLDDASGSQDRSRPKCQNMLSCTTLSFVG